MGPFWLVLTFLLCFLQIHFVYINLHFSGLSFESNQLATSYIKSQLLHIFQIEIMWA